MQDKLLAVVIGTLAIGISAIETERMVLHALCAWITHVGLSMKYRLPYQIAACGIVIWSLCGTPDLRHLPIFISPILHAAVSKFKTKIRAVFIALDVVLMIAIGLQTNAILITSIMFTICLPIASHHMNWVYPPISFGMIYGIYITQSWHLISIAIMYSYFIYAHQIQEISDVPIIEFAKQNWYKLSVLGEGFVVATLSYTNPKQYIISMLVWHIGISTEKYHGLYAVIYTIYIFASVKLDIAMFAVVLCPIFHGIALFISDKHIWLVPRILSVATLALVGYMVSPYIWIIAGLDIFGMVISYYIGPLSQGPAAGLVWYAAFVYGSVMHYSKLGYMMVYSMFMYEEFTLLTKKYMIITSCLETSEEGAESPV